MFVNLQGNPSSILRGVFDFLSGINKIIDLINFPSSSSLDEGEVPPQVEFFLLQEQPIVI
jgi:hypothetical protein